MDHDAEDMWTPEHGITAFVVEEFTAGACHHLALALHQVTGWSMMAEMDPQAPEAMDAAFHYWVVNAQGRAVDIQGVHSTEWASTAYSGGAPLGPIKAIPANRLLSTPDQATSLQQRIACEYREWADTLVNHFPAHFGIPSEQ